jgi:uncharacterized protein YbaR (Trm112 family)
MARFTSKTNSLERISSYGQTISCPVCNNTFMLKDTKDGDQAYWCHTCERGWRIGHLPPEARRAKAKALLETALEAATQNSPHLPDILAESRLETPAEPPTSMPAKPRLKAAKKPQSEVSSQPPVAVGMQPSLFDVSR